MAGSGKITTEYTCGPVTMEEVAPAVKAYVQCEAGYTRSLEAATAEINKLFAPRVAQSVAEAVAAAREQWESEPCPCNKIPELLERHTSELAAIEQRHAAELAQSHERYEAELAKLNGELTRAHRYEIKAINADHAAKLSEKRANWQAELKAQDRVMVMMRGHTAKAVGAAYKEAARIATKVSKEDGNPAGANAEYWIGWRHAATKISNLMTERAVKPQEDGPTPCPICGHWPYECKCKTAPWDKAAEYMRNCGIPVDDLTEAEWPDEEVHSVDCFWGIK